MMLSNGNRCVMALVSGLRNFCRSHRAFSSRTSSTDVLFFGTDQYSIYAFQSLLKSMEVNTVNIGRLGVCSRFHEPVCELAKMASQEKLSKRIVHMDYRDILR